MGLKLRKARWLVPCPPGTQQLSQAAPNLLALFHLSGSQPRAALLPRDTWTIWTQFRLSRGLGASGSWWMGARDAAKHPQAQGSAYSEELSGPVPSSMAPGRKENSIHSCHYPGYAMKASIWFNIVLYKTHGTLSWVSVRYMWDTRLYMIHIHLGSFQLLKDDKFLTLWHILNFHSIWLKAGHKAWHQVPLRA